MSTATFQKTDTTTQGTWYASGKTVYGGDGWDIADYGTSNPNIPAYATLTISGASVSAWTTSTSDVRGLEYPPVGTSNGSDTNRIAAVWFNPSGTNFTLDIQDGSTHQVALYFLDWDNAGRALTVTITDDLNGNVQLDSRSLSSFNNGVWLVWRVSGKVTFTITQTAGPNAVVSGIFFDTPIGTLFPPIVSRPKIHPAYYE